MDGLLGLFMEFSHQEGFPRNVSTIIQLLVKALLMTNYPAENYHPQNYGPDQDDILTL